MNSIGAKLGTFVTEMTKTDAILPVIALETTVTGGRTAQAYKRGGENEARERFIEESTGAIVWLGGVKCLNDYVGDPILKKLFGENFDVGTDNVLRTPFKNFLKKHPQKRFSPKQVALIKATKVLASVLLADAFIGLVVPPLNQKLTKNLHKKNLQKQQEKQASKLDIIEGNSNPTFKGSIELINTFTNAIENTNTGKLLSTDAGLISGRLYSARNNDERREIAIRDIGSIYFYIWAQPHVCKVLNFIESGKSMRLNPNTTADLDKYLSKFLESQGGEMSVEEFRKKVLGKNSSEIKIPSNIKFETAEISQLTKFFDKFRKNPTEPLKVAKVADLESLNIEKEVMDRIRGMSKLQPLREGEAVVTKQQIIDAYNDCRINDPEFLDKVFDNFTGAKNKNGKYTPGASKNEFKYVSNDKLYALKGRMEDYVEDICKKAKDGKITKELLAKCKKQNLIFNGINFIAGFVVAATFLSTLIPKFQYWYTRMRTGQNVFPGTYNLDEA